MPTSQELAQLRDAITRGDFEGARDLTARVAPSALRDLEDNPQAFLTVIQRNLGEAETQIPEGFGPQGGAGLLNIAKAVGGGALGAKAGAMLGALGGPAAPITIPAGTFLGGMLGANAPRAIEAGDPRLLLPQGPIELGAEVLGGGLLARQALKAARRPAAGIIREVVGDVGEEAVGEAPRRVLALPAPSVERGGRRIFRGGPPEAGSEATLRRGQETLVGRPDRGPESSVIDVTPRVDDVRPQVGPLAVQAPTGRVGVVRQSTGKVIEREASPLAQADEGVEAAAEAAGGADPRFVPRRLLGNPDPEIAALRPGSSTLSVADPGVQEFFDEIDAIVSGAAVPKPPLRKVVGNGK